MYVPRTLHILHSFTAKMKKIFQQTTAINVCNMHMDISPEPFSKRALNDLLALKKTCWFAPVPQHSAWQILRRVYSLVHTISPQNSDPARKIRSFLTYSSPVPPYRLLLCIRFSNNFSDLRSKKLKVNGIRCRSVQGWSPVWKENNSL